MTPFNQLGFVVNDVDEAVAYWVDTIGVAPFFVYRDFTLAECVYEGDPIELTISVAYGQAGDVQIELVEQQGDTRSPYLGRESGHFHHVAVWTRDYDRQLETYRSRGLTEVMWGSASGRSDERFAYLAPAGPGPMLELVEVLDAKTEWYRSIAEAARTYDGTEPVREAAART